jgi:hypothetical protein
MSEQLRGVGMVIGVSSPEWHTPRNMGCRSEQFGFLRFNLLLGDIQVRTTGCSPRPSPNGRRTTSLAFFYAFLHYVEVEFDLRFTRSATNGITRIDGQAALCCCLIPKLPTQRPRRISYSPNCLVHMLTADKDNVRHKLKEK